MMGARLRVGLLVTAGALALVAAPAALAAAPGTPDLDAASDLGASSTDNITSDPTPDFTIASNPGAGTVVLCVISSGSTGTPTSYGTPTGVEPVYIQGTSTLADGTYNVTARTVSCAAGEGSGTLVLTIDTSAPSIVGAPALVDFVGSSSTVTFTTTPRFDVTVATGATVTLYEGSTAIGTGTSADGAARVIVSSALADGSHTVTAKATDPAGNESAVSSSTTITVDSSAAAASTPDLLDADDDGASSTDNYTTNPRPRFTVTSEASARITLYEDGVALGSAVADSAGVATVQVREALWLDPGVHCLYAIAMDSLANAGSPSSDLCITVAPGVEPFTTNLGLTIDGSDLVASLTSAKAARVKVTVMVQGRVVAAAGGKVKAGKRVAVKLRLKGPAAKARRLLIVATFKTANGKTVVVRRIVVRR